MKALGVLAPLFSIAASISVIYWNLWARRKYAGNPKEEPLFRKTLRISITIVVGLGIIILLMLLIFVIVYNTLHNLPS